MALRRAFRCAALFLLPLFALPLGAAQVSISLGTIHHPAFEAEGVKLVFDAARRGVADIRMARLRVAGNEYRQLDIHCADFFFDGNRLECPQGTVRRNDERGRNRPALPFSLSWRAHDGFLEFALQDVDAVALSPLVPRLRGWRPAGKIDFRLAVLGGKAKLDLALRDIAFANREGSIAGAQIALKLNADAERSSTGWRWRARLDWPQGELMRAPWRRRAGVSIDAQGSLAEDELRVELARLDVAEIGSVAASLRWDRLREEATEWGFVSEPLDLSTAMREAVQPWLSALGFPEWRVSGRARFSAEWKMGALRRFYAGLEDARLADATGYIELSGVNARIPWEEGAATDAEIAVAAGRLGDLPLDGFTIPLGMAGSEARIKALSAPMLDGRFVVDDFRLVRREAGWQGEFEGGIEGVSMPKLSRALRLPAMAGSFTARVPRIVLDGSTLRLDGALGIEVFDGGITVHQLRVIDPFSASRRFVVDVTARNLDLGMLTHTYAFGSIEGRFDADLHDLELLGWKPLRFEARVASSEGNYPRVLSFGALKDITALGKEGEAATLSRMPARSGPSFGYDRIGFGCKLDNGVCLLDGVERAGEGIVLMQGSGIPSVSIIGYNRRIAWDALVARFREVIAGRPGLVIE
jgi:hypothetical protein